MAKAHKHELDAVHITDLVIGVTVHRPNLVELERLILTLAACTSLPVLIIDGPVGEAIEADELATLRTVAPVEIIQFDKNRGVGAGLNAIVACARARGARFVLFFDQDSAPSPDLVARLHRDITTLRSVDARVATVGPRPVPRTGSGTKAPTYSRRTFPTSIGRLSAVDFVITSGSLMALDAIEDIGPFTEKYRMDAIDLDWCFRAWAKGWSVWVAEDLEMEHAIGNAQVKLGPYGFPHQTESRMRTYVRAQAHLLTRSYVPWHWKARSVLYVPAQAIVVSAGSAHPAKTLIGLAKAMAAGLIGRFDDQGESGPSE